MLLHAQVPSDVPIGMLAPKCQGVLVGLISRCDMGIVQLLIRNPLRRSGWPYWEFSLVSPYLVRHPFWDTAHVCYAISIIIVIAIKACDICAELEHLISG